MKILKKTYLSGAFNRWDLQVKNNHNFVANGAVVHNSNQSCVFSDGEFHVKSRNLWKKDNGRSDFWRAFHANEPLKEFLVKHPNYLVQGELCGKVKGFTYGIPKGNVEFLAFDIRKPDYHYMDSCEFQEVCSKFNIKTPRIFESASPYSKELVDSHTEGDQFNNPSGIREGVIIRPQKERFEYRLNGRLIVKSVSNTYLEKKKK